MDPTLRLLPWTTPDGRPCYLSADPDSPPREVLFAGKRLGVEEDEDGDDE